MKTMIDLQSKASMERKIWPTVTQAKKTSFCVTRAEIDKFWRKKRMEEEEHLISALKAAARIKARSLTVEEYQRFEDSLKVNDTKDNNGNTNKEVQIGIKDWWTKSKYAYLNQPAIQSTDPPKRTTTFIPNLCFYSPHPTQPKSLGVF